MKKFFSILTPILLALMLVLFCCACEKESVLYTGFDVELLEVDAGKQTIRVRDLREEGKTFGQDCTLDCSELTERGYILYVNYDTSEETYLSLSDLQPGDELFLSIHESELAKVKSGKARLYGIQLGTQRFS
ncbi:hypothetical protein [Negativibacillus massiliensis]|uniref:hypothetical protein n=1 Tax=Negativibacillus massiliensis TaxID=1871035 RepID=UPI002A836B43|nr:hypothetical protein [Negativibacillus massiliensis]MDY4046635.1 hypothetical protein [Negativibacillus massiliensis]